MGINHIESGISSFLQGITDLRSEVVVKSISDASIALPGVNTVVVVTPPEGYKWNIMGLFLDVAAVAGASVGTHSFLISNNYIEIITGISPYSNSIQWNTSCWIVATTSQSPNDQAAALNGLQNCIFTKDYPLVVVYYNGSDVANAAPRTIKATIIQETLQ